MWFCPTYHIRARRRIFSRHVRLPLSAQKNSAERGHKETLRASQMGHVTLWQPERGKHCAIHKPHPMSTLALWLWFVRRDGHSNLLCHAGSKAAQVCERGVPGVVQIHNPQRHDKAIDLMINTSESIGFVTTSYQQGYWSDAKQTGIAKFCHHFLSRRLLT